MCAVGFEPALKAAGFDSLNQIRDFGIRENRIAEGLNIFNVSTLYENAVRNRRFKFGITHKTNHAVDFFFWNVEQFRERANMGIVLAQWILELVFLFKVNLRPFRAFGVGENPALVIFGFNHEQAESGNDHMINLRSAPFGRNRHVFDQVIDIGIEPELCRQIYKALPDLSFRSRREQLD